MKRPTASVSAGLDRSLENGECPVGANSNSICPGLNMDLVNVCSTPFTGVAISKKQPVTSSLKLLFPCMALARHSDGVTLNSGALSLDRQSHSKFRSRFSE